MYTVASLRSAWGAGTRLRWRSSADNEGGRGRPPLHSQSHDEAAAHIQRLACDPVRLWRTKEENHFGDLIGVTQSSKGLPTHREFENLSIREVSRRHVGINVSGRDCIHT